MVQIIGSPKSFGSSFSEGLSKSLPDALGNLIERKRQANQLLEEDEALESQGIHVKGIRNPKIREGLLDVHKKQKKDEFEAQQDLKGAETLGKYFGPEAAEIYPQLTEGGKTKFFESLLDARTRNIPIPEFIGQYVQANPQDLKENDGNTEDLRAPSQAKQDKFKDPDAGLTPNERVKRQEKRYDKNLPLYEDHRHKSEALQHETDTIEILEDLNESKKLPSGLGRANVDYKSGRLQIPALASPEAQRYIKTVNEFLTNAKDTFGARISNFELDTFLQRLPTLANTEEGRREILKQMKYFNAIQSTYQKELADVVEEAGGIRNIDWDQAQRMAEKRATPKITEAKNQFRNADKISKEIYQKKLDEVKSKTPKGKVAVEKDGQFGYIDKKNLYKATKSGGYKRV